MTQESMNTLISFFGVMFYVCLAIAVIGLGLALLFFFVFDIRDIFAWKTGRMQKKTLERMEAQNAKTGRLTMNANSGNIKRSGPVIQPPAPAEANLDTAQLGTNDETSLLSEQAGETSVLSTEEAATSVLNQRNASASAAALEEKLRSYVPPIAFEVTEKTLVVHTDEII